MHIAYLNYYYDEDLRDTEELLSRYSTMTDWCSSVKTAGAELVSVLQRFRVNGTTVRDSVRYHFIADGGPCSPGWRRDPREFHEALYGVSPDVLHVNGTVYPLTRLEKKFISNRAVLWQHHGGPPPPLYSRPCLRRAFRSVDGVLFTSNDQAGQWESLNILNERHAVYDVVECSTRMRAEDYRACRIFFGMGDEAIFLWVGRLDENKDPLACVRGFAGLAAIRLDARLMMVYSDGPLEVPLRREINRLGLDNRVVLIGRVPHSEMPGYYSAADYFLLGSHYEGSGFALIEAIACGVTPVVTDIPPFRKITGNGTIGFLWEAGDPRSLGSALLKAVSVAPERACITGFFETHLAWRTLGSRACRIYSEALRKKLCGAHIPPASGGRRGDDPDG